MNSIIGSESQIINKFTTTLDSNFASLAKLLPPGEEIFDIYDLTNVIFPLYSLLVLIFFIGVLSVLLYTFSRFIFNTYKKIKIQDQKANHVQQIVDPTNEAIIALQNLKNSSFWEIENIKNLSEQLALIIKKFVKSKYKIGIGVASTSDELIQQLKTSNFPSKFINDLSEILDRLDSIKYKGIIPSYNLENYYQSIYDFIIQHSSENKKIIE